MKKIILPLVLMASLVWGCKTIAPGADPLVVRVEQTESTANATFDMILHIDSADRGFWKTNAPAFHSFCEWLRTHQTYGTNIVPRCVAIQLNADDLKLAYKASKTTGTSNALWSAWVTLNAALAQSVSWSNIITAPIHP